MTSVPVIAPARRPFKPTHCLDCGYALEGLPESGVCPECGVAYREDTMVLWGWPPGRGGTLEKMRKRPAWRMWGYFFPLFLALYYAAWGGWIMAGFMLVIGLLPLLWLIRVLGQGYTKPPRPLQVRLSPRGIGQRVGYGAMAMAPWPKKVIVELRRPDKSPGRVSCHTETILGAMQRRYCNLRPDIDDADWPALVAWLTEQAAQAGGKVRYSDM